MPMSDNDSAFVKLFAETPSSSTENTLVSADKINTLRIFGIYVIGVLGVELVPILMNTDWNAVIGKPWGHTVATVVGLVGASALDLFRRWKTDYAPGKTPPADQNTPNPYNRI